ncbi:MAG: cytochrome c-type biogenesis protein CcmH [bacterium]
MRGEIVFSQVGRLSGFSLLKVARRIALRVAAGPAVLTVSALLTAFMLLAVLTAGQVWGLSENEIEKRTLRIADQLRCPTCQGLSVRDSTAPLSRQIQDKVRRMVAEGQSEEAIKAFFVSRYGEWILRAPKKEGLGLVLWLLPGLALLVSAGLIGYRLLGNHRERVSAASEPTPILTEAQRARIASDIKTFEEQE